MFRKRAVVITQCLGAGARSAARDIRDSLNWRGISDTGVFRGALMEEVSWDALGVRRMASSYRRKVKKPAGPSLMTVMKFTICRMMQKKTYSSETVSRDAAYWKEMGWFDGKRPRK